MRVVKVGWAALVWRCVSAVARRWVRLLHHPAPWGVGLVGATVLLVVAAWHRECFYLAVFSAGWLLTAVGGVEALWHWASQHSGTPSASYIDLEEG